MTQTLEANLDSLFQTALLLTAEPETAEAIIASSLEVADLLGLPEENACTKLKEAIVLRSVQRERPVSSADILNARAMLQPGLWAVLQIERQPRLCFVLRLLLGFATSSCAQILAIEEQAVKALLQNAFLQLQLATAENPPERLQGRPPRIEKLDGELGGVSENS
jgi:hypothetical protein